MKKYCLIALLSAGLVCLGDGLKLPSPLFKASVRRQDDLKDSSGPRPNKLVTLSSPFPFLGDHYCDGSSYGSLPDACNGVEGTVVFDQLWIHDNGILSLGTEWKDAFLNSFPRLGPPAIAPLWSMLTFGDWGGVYFSERERAGARKRISQEVIDYFPCIDSFSATMVLDVTWHKMPYDPDCEDSDKIGQCMCLVEFDEDTCACKELPIQDYCACVSDNPPVDCTCRTVVEEYNDICACMESQSASFCICVHQDFYSEEYCGCLEDTGNSGVCYCVESGRGDQEYCQCLSDNSYDYNYCSGDYKREVPSDKVKAIPQKIFSPHQAQRSKRQPGLDRDKRGRAAGPSHNTFQALLLTDGDMSFIIFNYASIDIPEDVFGGRKAVVGFDGGRQDYPWGPAFNHQYSQSSELYKLISESNVGVPGQWIYRVDDTIFQPSDC